MARGCNEELKRIADGSEIRLSCIPVFICDGELNICTKSVGAKQLVPRPYEKSSMKKYFSKESLRRIYASEGHVFSISFGTEQSDSNVIVVSGEIHGEKYYCFIVKLNILFCPYPEPWYLENACRSLSHSVNGLLLSESSEHAELNRYCALISRLCAMSEKRTYEGGFPKLADAPLQEVIRTLEAECPKALTLVGASVTVDSELPASLVPVISARSIYTMISTLLVSLVTVAQNGKVSIFCVFDEEDADSANIELSVLADISKQGEIFSFDDLIDSVPPLKLELAALRDMAESSGVSLDCRTDGGELTVAMKLAVRHAEHVVFRADDITAHSMYAAGLLSELCALIAA